VTTPGGNQNRSDRGHRSRSRSLRGRAFFCGQSTCRDSEITRNVRRQAVKGEPTMIRGGKLVFSVLLRLLFRPLADRWTYRIHADTATRWRSHQGRRTGSQILFVLRATPHLGRPRSRMFWNIHRVNKGSAVIRPETDRTNSYLVDESGRTEEEESARSRKKRCPEISGYYKCDRESLMRSCSVF